MNSRKPSAAKKQLILAIGILFIGMCLRAPFTSIGPLLEIVQKSLHLSTTAIGLVNALPLLAFATVSPMVPSVSRKLGLELAAYYRNHQEKQGISSPVTLLDLWNWRLGKEGGELKLPVLVLRDGSLLPEGVLTVQLSDRTCYKKKQEAKHSLPA